ncbi:RsiV family protein [Velocimicrobium porci]|uniref:Anti-sigma-V factor rsiV n=1 Tax=Velocimicrobium porci TaxID=2606634 RepID=A0A6L5Y1C7_9FIRM|nr:RsiV family protein [Velocimicrobium porci]MSS63933.1 anti-sigma-V factor rsiV [Velocimicrobium porci]
MKKFEEAKKIYDKIEIPEELSGVVKETIEQHKQKEVKIRVPYWRYSVLAAASVMLCFTITLNTNASFAKTVKDVPILKTIAKILTIRSYEEKDDDKTTTVNVPAIEDKREETSRKINDINKTIDEKIESYVKRASEDIKEYKKAFMETGGTEEEWKEKDIHVNVDYKVMSQTENYVSFVISGCEDWTSAYSVDYFYNINLNTGEDITLEELLGKDYIEKANQSIRSQMKERTEKNKELTYFTKEEGGFETISKDVKFYINKKGNPVIVFDKYEVAPGFMGQQEFEIK